MVSHLPNHMANIVSREHISAPNPIHIHKQRRAPRSQTQKPSPAERVDSSVRDKLSQRCLEQPSTNPTYVKKRSFTEYSSPAMEVETPEKKQRKLKDGDLLKICDLLIDRNAVSHFRNRMPYGTNITPARTLDDKTDHQCPSAYLKPPKNLSEMVQFARLEDGIMDHAYRRIQILYYVFVAYFNEGCKVEWDSTMHQHGFSQCPKCSGAHSNILPNLKDDWFGMMIFEIHKKGLTLDMENKLRSLGIKEKGLELLKKEGITLDNAIAIFDGIDMNGRKRLIAPPCHFYHVMNMTVELPDCVNQIDNLIERTMRTRGIELLNQVSKGEIHPYQALNIFVEELKAFLIKCEAATLSKLTCMRNIYENEIKLLGLEQTLRLGLRVLPESWMGQFQIVAKTLDYLKKEWLEMKDYSPIYKLPLRLPHHANLLNYALNHHRDKVKTYNWIKEEILKIPLWAPEPISDIEQMLKDSTRVIQLQLKATAMPDLELLSGKLDSGKLTQLQEKDLKKQKLEIIDRRIEDKMKLDDEDLQQQNQEWIQCVLL